jgi:hypothetical protein
MQETVEAATRLTTTAMALSDTASNILIKVSLVTFCANSSIKPICPVKPTTCAVKLPFKVSAVTGWARATSLTFSFGSSVFGVLVVVGIGVVAGPLSP